MPQGENRDDEPGDTEKVDGAQENDDEGQQQQQQGYNAEAMNGGFQNMGFQSQGDFNQMQMMMSLQNGMAPASFGGFPMMGEF